MNTLQVEGKEILLEWQAGGKLKEEKLRDHGTLLTNYYYFLFRCRVLFRFRFRLFLFFLLF